METDLSLRKSLFKMFDVCFGTNRLNFEFPSDPSQAYIQAFQNNNPRPGAKTLLYYYVDNLDNWKGARHAPQMATYNRQEGKTTYVTMRQFDCVVDIYSKTSGVALDAMSFLIEMLRSDRWDNLTLSNGWFLGKESVSAPTPIREIENSTWVDRSRCRISLNFRDDINIFEELLELAYPSDMEDMENIVPIEGEEI